MSVTVVVPARDYIIPVEQERDYVSLTRADGFPLINATDYLLINATDKLIIRGGSAIRAPFLPVDYRDYIIPVPERLTSG